MDLVARLLRAFPLLLLAASSPVACDRSSPMPPSASPIGTPPSATPPAPSSSSSKAASGDATASAGVLAPPVQVAPIPAVAGGRLSATAAAPFDVDAWLTACGASWRPDAACWSTLAGSPHQSVNQCSCTGALVLPEAAVLVCSRGREQKAELVPFVVHTVLYVAERGALRAVLDLPTSAALDECPPQNPALCKIAIAPSIENGVLRFSDAAKAPGGSSCEDALSTIDAAHQGAAPADRPAWHEARDLYRRVCNGRGRYLWQGRALRHAP